MCLLILAYGVLDDSPLVVAANREERVDRSAVGPYAWPEPPGIVAARDLEAEGTWLGIHQRGLLAAIVNLHTTDTVDPQATTRGILPVEALQGADVDQATQRVMACVTENTFNSFVLAITDARMVAIITHDGEQTTCEQVPPGLCVITNAGVNAEDDARASAVREYWQRRTPRSRDDAISTLTETCIELAVPVSTRRWQGQFIRSGTVSSSIVSYRYSRSTPRDNAIRPPGSATTGNTDLQKCGHTALEPGQIDEFLFADGPPGQVKYDTIELEFSGNDEANVDHC